jgi:hypothetical protein
MMAKKIKVLKCYVEKYSRIKKNGNFKSHPSKMIIYKFLKCFHNFETDEVSNKPALFKNKNEIYSRGRYQYKLNTESQIFQLQD